MRIILYVGNDDVTTDQSLTSHPNATMVDTEFAVETQGMMEE